MAENMSEKITAGSMIVFDLDDTLHMRSAPFAESVSEFFHISEPDQVKRMFTDFRMIGVEYFHQWDAGTITEQDMYIRRTADTFALYGIHLTASDLGLPMGILTNGSPVRQRDKIRTLGLERWIPAGHIAVSLELGVHKPDPEVFRRYQEMILSSAEEAVSPAEWWYVGDLYENDIGPAIRAGWHTVWMVHDEEDRAAEYAHSPDYIVRSGQELRDVFRKIAEEQ